MGDVGDMVDVVTSAGVVSVAVVLGIVVGDVGDMVDVVTSACVVSVAVVLVLVAVAFIVLGIGT